MVSWNGQVITINGMFPGPLINATTNDNVYVNVFNNLDEPFLMTWYEVIVWKNHVWMLSFVMVFYSFSSEVELNTCMWMQEWNPAEAKFMARWSVWDQLPHPTRKQLDLCFPDQGPNRQLFLLPHNWVPKGSWWVRPNSSKQQKCYPRALSKARSWVWCSYWWLV